MATFRPVNNAPLAPDPQGHNPEETNPLTPRSNAAPNTQMQNMSRDDATTPTRANFGALASQRPLPSTSPFPSAITVPSNDEPKKTQLNRGNSQHSTKSRESEDVDMDEDGDEEGEEGSEDESVNDDGTRSKKKKSQRFYCTDYPPCSLSFTRSEHLARHIRYVTPPFRGLAWTDSFRKHTGERPFQCHCSRRFSRLDNLRQHAQTVHQNEEIPQDSLAATGTRFQRQVRTDRVRPPGSRSRAGTAGSVPGVRGHHRNSLSASSIGSVASTYSQNADVRRRPPPLVMAGEPRNRFSQEIYGRPDSPSYQYRPNSPGGFSTPTSATFSTGQNSPRWGSAMQSPSMGHSRTQSVYAGHRTPGRRLSVPSAGNPFTSPHAGQTFGPPLLGNNQGGFSPTSSMISSPTTSTSGSTYSRRESINSSDDPWRRRTWHPDTYSSQIASFGSRLQHVTTADNYYSSGQPPQPPTVPSNAPPLQPMRLPGIESFDPLPPRPSTPVRRQPSPMMIDTPSRQMPHPAEQYPPERPNSQHWDQGINRNMNRLDLTQGTPQTDTASSWATEANRAVQAQAEQARTQPAVRFEESPYSARPHTSSGAFHQHTVSAPPVTPREAKRQAWYHGPVPTQRNMVPAQRTSPAESSDSERGIPHTPSSSTLGEYNPSIVHANGWVENRNGSTIPPPQDPRVVPSNGYTPYPSHSGTEAPYTYAASAQQQAQQRQHQIPKPTDSNMLRLEALVAVATSEENVAAAY